MFLVEEKTSATGRSASIYMRDDGLFEGRIYKTAAMNNCNSDFDVCGVTETLPRLEAIVDEELDL